MSESRSVSVSRSIEAAPEKIFAVLTDPELHRVIDGSDTVVGQRSGAVRLTLGSKFGMKMKMCGIPYRMSNVVKEYEENQLIAWAHIGGHRWRYELEALEGETMVTETFDWSTSRSPWLIERFRYPQKHLPNMKRTLDRLADHLSES